MSRRLAGSTAEVLHSGGFRRFLVLGGLSVLMLILQLLLWWRQTREVAGQYLVVTWPPGAKLKLSYFSDAGSGFQTTTLPNRTPGPFQVGGGKLHSTTLQLDGFQDTPIPPDFSKGGLRYPTSGEIALKPLAWWSWPKYLFTHCPLLVLAGLGSLGGLAFGLWPWYREERQARRAQRFFRMGKIVPGCRIERYVVDSPLGKGGMAQVFRCHRLDSPEAVALKIVHFDRLTQEDQERFDREIQLVRQLQHPHLICYLDHGEHLGVPFVVTELLEGSPLDALLRTSPEGRQRVFARRMHQLAQVLSYIHERGVIHRDLKPSNVFVQENAGQEHLVLMDLGIARFEQANQTSADILGTAGYMSPEQISGAPMTWRSDIYNLGLMAVVLWTGESPFGHGDPLELIHRQMSQPQLDLPAAWSEDFRKLVAGWLSSDPELRASQPHDPWQNLQSVLPVPKQRPSSLDLQRG